MYLFPQLAPAPTDKGIGVPRTGKKVRMMDVMNAIRMRQLEEDARRAEQSVVGVMGGVGHGTVLPHEEPSSVGGAPITSEQITDKKAINRLLSDRYEEGLAAKSQKQTKLETNAIDSKEDGEARAARHMRVRTAPVPLPTSNLLTTLAAERKQRIRTNRRVAKKQGSTSNTFGHLPHPGAWKAQSIDKARIKQQNTRPLPRYSFPAPRHSIHTT